MTNKELVEEQIKKWDSVLYPQMYSVALVKDFIRKAFLAGLNAGRPVWHDLMKNPDDLPPLGKGCERTSIRVVDEYDRIITYDYGSERWRDYECDFLNIQPALWCEVPKYTEE